MRAGIPAHGSRVQSPYGRNIPTGPAFRTYRTSLMQAYTAAQVAELDRYTTEDLGVDLKQLMEIAGMRSAESAVKLFGIGKDITVLAGPGGNGGDALVAAKWLKLWGCNPTVIMSHEFDHLKEVITHQYDIWKNYGGEEADTPPVKTDGIIDGLLGYSLEGDPRDRAADLIVWANESGAPILSLDVPSGLDATTGEARDPCITARHTVVFGVMKQGLQTEEGQKRAGTIELIDIGFPREFPKTSP